MKKTVILSLVAALLLAGVLAYFAPMKLTRNVTEDMDIRMVLNVFCVEDVVTASAGLTGSEYGDGDSGAFEDLFNKN